MKRLALSGLLLAAGFSTGLSTAHAGPNISWGVTISGGTPPPPVRYEPPPPPRSGYVWAEGYWNWNGGAYVWVPGRWVRARSGYEYTQPQWHEGPQGWELQRGGWKRGNSGHCPPGQRKKGNC